MGTQRADVSGLSSRVLDLSSGLYQCQSHLLCAINSHSAVRLGGPPTPGQETWCLVHLEGISLTQQDTAHFIGCPQGGWPSEALGPTPKRHPGSLCWRPPVAHTLCWASTPKNPKKQACVAGPHPPHKEFGARPFLQVGRRVYTSDLEIDTCTQIPEM